MKLKALSAFKSKLSKPCKKLVQIFKFRFKKPMSIKPRKSRRRNSHPKKGVRALLSSLMLHPAPRTEVDRVSSEPTLFSASPLTPPFMGYSKLFPSPFTPAFKTDDQVEAACRSFENYLTDMVVEEGKIGDLTDLEEFLYCWKNLKCPVFTSLVCRFYGELCKDLFSDQVDDDQSSPVIAGSK